MKDVESCIARVDRKPVVSTIGWVLTRSRVRTAPQPERYPAKPRHWRHLKHTTGSSPHRINHIEGRGDVLILRRGVRPRRTRGAAMLSRRVRNVLFILMRARRHRDPKRPLCLRLRRIRKCEPGVNLFRKLHLVLLRSVELRIIRVGVKIVPGEDDHRVRPHSAQKIRPRDAFCKGEERDGAAFRVCSIDAPMIDGAFISKRCCNHPHELYNSRFVDPTKRLEVNLRASRERVAADDGRDPIRRMREADVVDLRDIRDVTATRFCDVVVSILCAEVHAAIEIDRNRIDPFRFAPR